MRSKRKYTIILSPAHGVEVPGKRNCNGSYAEWEWSRQQLRLLATDLERLGFTVTTDNDWADNEIGLTNRVKNMNLVKGPALVFALHSNGTTMDGCGGKAVGSVIYTCKGVTKSDAMATIAYASIAKNLPDRRLLRDRADGDDDFEANFTVLMSKHPSFLLEAAFHDNEDEVKLLRDPVWCGFLRKAIVDAIVQIDREV
jgi:N-acetylmuramoyl-L-alanine amidase